MILRPQIQPTAQEAVDYYMAHCDEVHIVICGKCEEDLALEIKGGQTGLPANASGYSIIPISAKMLSSRVRLDGMTGYQCLCGNDTRSNPHEEAASPRGEFLPHEVAAAHRRMAETGWKPLVTQEGNKQHRESFTVERVK